MFVLGDDTVRIYNEEEQQITETEYNEDEQIAREREVEDENRSTRRVEAKDERRKTQSKEREQSDNQRARIAEEYNKAKATIQIPWNNLPEL